MQELPRRPKPRAEFYGSREWKKLAAAIKAERGALCEDPLCKTPHRGRGQQIEADHIIELVDGGAKFDRRNILLRCSRCHRLKTERVERFRKARALQANWSDWSGWRGGAL